ncbi:MAG: hypothetical protein CMP09_11495 [Yangia sp.]|nr:hypothetical protein [Salipiger sp.]
MAKKEFAMLDTSILHMRAFRDLTNCSDRNLYFTAHLSAQADFCGLFRYPVSLIADETRLQPEDVLKSLDRLSRAGLLEYDPQAEIIRMCGWFRSVNCPKNADHTRQVARHFLSGELPVTDMARRTVAEFVIGCLLQTKRFKRSSSHGERVVEEVRRFLDDAWEMYDDLALILEDQYRTHGAAVVFEYEDVMRNRRPAWRQLPRAAVAGGSTHDDGTVTSLTTHPDHRVVPYIERNKEREKDGGAFQVRPLPETMNSKICQDLRAMNARRCPDG